MSQPWILLGVTYASISTTALTSMPVRPRSEGMPEKKKEPRDGTLISNQVALLEAAAVSAAETRVSHAVLKDVLCGLPLGVWAP